MHAVDDIDRTSFSRVGRRLRRRPAPPAPCAARDAR
ncbi:UNVERIFIED_ORG: hypothetical protein J2W38_003464 [Variovorax paradoxus]|nr:hypothetical protein [Variovorax paradoxus]